MIALFLLALLPRVEIVAANDSTLTYRELVPLRVALDPMTHLFHFKGCPDIQPDLEWASPAAANLRGYTQHTCVALRKTEYLLDVEKRSPRDHRLISVLFLGNSLTYFNDMPHMASQIAAKESRPLLVDSVTLSGASLEDLWFRTDAIQRIWQSHWDYVIIQERGGRAAMDRGELFHKYLGMFACAAYMSGAKPVLFMTWYPGNEAFFRAAAERAQTLLLPVGLHWEEQFDLDGTHPNVAGSRMIACLVYSMIYKKPCGEESLK